MPNVDKREQAVRKVAKQVLSLSIEMEHRDSERRVTMTQLRELLERAYDEGRRSASS